MVGGAGGKIAAAAEPPGQSAQWSAPWLPDPFMGNPIGVAEYQLQAKLPAELRGKLPSPKQLQDLVRDVLPDLEGD